MQVEQYNPSARSTRQRFAGGALSARSVDKPTLLANIAVWAKPPAKMQLYRQKDAAVGMAKVVQGAGAAMPAYSPSPLGGSAGVAVSAKALHG